MSAYIHGNLAVERKEIQRAPAREKMRMVVHRSSLTVKEKLFYLFIIVMCVAVSGTIIWRYSQIYQMNTNIQHIKRQIQTLETDNIDLKLQVSQLKDPKRMLAEAEKYGLVTNEGSKSQAATSAAANNSIALNKK
ncbi:MAG: cell division protein FtsL [Paenibacillus sp. RIFOXYA1_FULL_44_5]|nr:MAG: cell division protein FtsL [Paenibacillus sp. RIFOXYA1_FULL_44_5]